LSSSGEGDPMNARRACALLVLLVSSIAAAGVAEAGGAQGAVAARAGATGCNLRSADGTIKHVIYIQFDNTHLTRDNPNVPSDLEQMPHLLHFLKDNGTVLNKQYTVL